VLLPKVNMALRHRAFQVLVTQLVGDEVIVFVDLGPERAACFCGDSATQGSWRTATKVDLIEAGEASTDVATPVVVIVVSHR
jgi:hypothetical protein